MQELGKLFSDAVLHIRDRVATPEQFYQLLPLEPVQKYGLDTIAERFKQASYNQKIVYSSQGTWVRPTDIKAGPASKMTKELYKLAEPYLPLLPMDASPRFRKFLQNIPFVSKLQIVDVLSFLQEQDPQNAIPLAQAHPMLNTREKLEVLYPVLESVSSNEDIRNDYLDDLTLYLAEDDTLQWFSDIYWGKEKARSLHVEGLLHFVSEHFQEILSGFLMELYGENFLLQFGDDISSEHKLLMTSEETPAIMNTRDRLRNLLLFLHSELDKITTDGMEKLLLILDTEGYIHPVGSDAPIHFTRDEKTYQRLLQSLGIIFVDAEFAEEHAIQELYAKAGITKVTPQDVIIRLQALLPTGGGPLTDAPEPLRTLEQLQHLFAYFYHYCDALALDEKDYEKLRALPLFLTPRAKS